MPSPSHIIETDIAETHGGGVRIEFIYSGLDAAIALIRSRLALGPDVPMKHKHIYRVREYDGHQNAFVYTAAG